MTITTVGVVTRDRLPSLVACLESYLENCQRHARIPEFVVADDSPGAEAADRTRAALRKLAQRFNARVRYGGQQEKNRFAAALAAESKVAGKIIYFLLFGDGRCTRSTGANRNCLLLDTVGTLILTVDDDTLCRTAAAPECETSPSFFSGHDPTAFWFFPDRARATQAVSSVDADVLTLHEPLLGSAVAGLGVPAESSGRVAMTLHGLVGDSGMGSPRYYLTLEGASRDRLVASPQAYRSAFESREILRSVRRPTITRGPFCMSTFFGLDNRLLLPPFFPIQRNSDGTFGFMLWKCVDGSHVAFLPWTLVHAPEPPRVFVPDEMWADAATVRMTDILTASLSGHEARTGCVTTATRLTDLGKYLRELGSLHPADFEAQVRGVQQFRNFAFITALHGQLHAYGASPSFWAEDIERMIELLSTAPSAEDYLVPRDLLHGRDACAARRLSQELVGKFGEVLEAWPALVAAATRLRVNGCRLTEAL